MFNEIERVGFLGLGAMGGGIAARLMDAGHTVIGWNRTRARGESLVEAGMGWADSPRELAGSVDVLFSMLTNTAAVVRGRRRTRRGAVRALPRHGVGRPEHDLAGRQRGDV